MPTVPSTTGDAGEPPPADLHQADPLRRARLRWRSRRGLLENDLFIERFFDRYAGSLTEAQARGLTTLMDLSDNDLLDLLLARKEPQGEAQGEEALQVLRMLRAPA